MGYHIIIFGRFWWNLFWSFLQAVSTLTFCASFTACSLKVQQYKRSWSPLWTSRFVDIKQPWPHFSWLHEKALRGDTNTVAGCSKAEPKNFALLQTPFLGVQDVQNSISWRWSLPLPTNPVWWGSMHAIRVIVVTDPQTDRTDYNTLHRS